MSQIGSDAERSFLGTLSDQIKRMNTNQNEMINEIVNLQGEVATIEAAVLVVAQEAASGGGEGGANYSLPTASSTTLGGVKIDGNNLSIDGNGILSATGGSNYSLPTASSTTLGGVKINGNNLSIDGNGILSATDTNTTYSVGDGGLTEFDFTLARKDKLAGLANYTLQIADATTLGGVKINGNNLSIDGNGILSATDTNTTYSVGDGGLTEFDFTLARKDKLAGLANYTLPIADGSTLGGVKTGTNVAIDNAGVISVPVGTQAATLGVVRADGATITCTNGLLSIPGGGGGGANILNDLTDCVLEYNSIYIGNDPSAATSTAEYNIGIGQRALDSVTSGNYNVAIGENAMLSLTTGNNNVAIGFDVLNLAVSATFNTAVGNKALQNTTAYMNTAVGYKALEAATTGHTNTTVGVSSLWNVVDGHSNLGFGVGAGNNITSGQNNICIGNSATTSGSASVYEIVIGHGAVGHGSNIAVIGDTNCTAWHPVNNGGVDLGSSSYKFKDLYINGVEVGVATMGTVNSAHFNNGTGGAGDAATFAHKDYGPSTSGITDRTFSGMMIRGDGNIIINTPTGKWAEWCVDGAMGDRVMAVGRTNWGMKGIELKGHDNGTTNDHRRLLEHDGDYMCNGYIRTGIFHDIHRNKHTGWMRGFPTPGFNNSTQKQRYFVFGSHEGTKDDGSSTPGDTTYWRKSAVLQTTEEDTAGDYNDYYPECTTFLNCAPTGLIYIGCDGPKKTTHNVFVDFLKDRGTSQADVQFRTDVNVTGAFTATTVTATGSDDRLKHNESVLSNSLQVIRKLRPKKYQKTTQMKAADYSGVVDGPYRWEAGLIAQDVLQIPELTYSVLAGDYKEKDRITFTTTLDVKNSEYKGDVYEAQVKAVVTGADISWEDGLPDENARVRVIIRTDTADPVVAALRAFDATAQITVKTGADVARPYALDYNTVSMYTLSALKELDIIATDLSNNLLTANNKITQLEQENATMKTALNSLLTAAGQNTI